MSKKQPTSTAHKVFTVIGIIMCVILIPMLIINITLIVKSYVNPDQVPGIGGKVPMIVLTESMEPTINAGDLIICDVVDANKIEKGDIISYFDPASKSNSVTTHSVIEIIEQDGELAFRTQGDNNNTADKLAVPASKLIGRYKMRIPGMGHVALFMQKPIGLVIFVAVPLLLLIAYDVIRRKQFEKANKADADALMSELEALKAEMAAKNAAESDEAVSAETTEDNAE